MHEKKNVLLINNSQVFTDMTKRVLERAGYAVRCATGGAAAREQMADFSPDAIILDSDLPEGLECFQGPGDENPAPVMIVSSDKNCELQALQSGAVEFMKKPFDFEIMKARLALMLKDAPTRPEAAEEQKGAGQGQADAAEGQKKTFRLRYVYVAAICIALALSGIGLLRMLSEPPEYVEIDGLGLEVPLANWTLEGEQDQTYYTEMAENGIEPPTIETEGITIPKGATKLKLPLDNPQGNPCLLSFELILEDTGESIYVSHMVEPGEGIGEIELSRGLAEGEHGLIVVIRAYEIGGLADMGRAEVPVTVTATAS